jgi:peptidoglycan/xylan/chitin deacetylase (PgdA/CDA1 family)
VKLVAPYIHEVKPEDTRLIRLAEFLGIQSLQVPLTKPPRDVVEAFASVPPEDRACLVIHPEVIREWTKGAAPTPQFVSSLISPFRAVLVHAVRPDPFHSKLISCLTAGRFHGVQQMGESHAEFTVAEGSRDICAAFAGLSIGAANAQTDSVFAGGNGARKLITVGDGAFFASTRLEDTEIFLLGSADVVDLESEASDSWLSETFSRFLPHAMALRHIFGEQCWRPAQTHANVIIDDPLLRPIYGFLNFERLLRLMEEHNFNTTIAFIPHNFRRSSGQVVRLFSEHEDRLSLCFHGNDHTGAEFAAKDMTLLHTMLRTADHRIAAHDKITGLPCERVMVFPQGRFSVEAMAALRTHNFEAAVNTSPNPWREPKRLPLRELAQPAVLRHASFPLFTRRESARMRQADIAFRIFFGIPLLIVEHHDAFENPQPLIEAVTRINQAAPDVRWSSVGTAVRGSVLRRRDEKGALRVKANAGTVRVDNPSNSPERVLVEWDYPGDGSQIESVCCNGLPCCATDVDDSGVRASNVLGASESALFSIRYRQADNSPVQTAFHYNVRAMVRRRLSELRDNYISKSPSLLAAAKTLQRRFL